MKRYNEENDFFHYYEIMSKKTTAELEKELAKLEKQADKYRPREFVGFRMTPQASRNLDVIAQQKMKIQTILYEREKETETQKKIERFKALNQSSSYRWSDADTLANFEKSEKIKEIYGKIYCKIDEPQTGDIVEFENWHKKYTNGKIVEDVYKMGDENFVTICESGGSFTNGEYFSTSGGAFFRFPKTKLKFLGKAKNVVWTWNVDGAGAGNGIYFEIDVNKWCIPYKIEL